MNTFAKTCAVWACAAALSACQTTPPVNPTLEAARAALSQAQANPCAPRAVAVELERARQALRRAETAWADRRDTDETQHLSYVVQRRTETALAVAMRAQSEEQVSQAGAERDRVRLEARTLEADAAARRAQAAQASAQSAQATARSAQSSVQTAQGQAEQARQETDAARQRLEQEQARAAALQPGAQRSVQRLRQVLLDADVAASRIEVRGHGEAYPVANNDSAAGRQQNRRVEVLFSDAQGRFRDRS